MWFIGVEVEQETSAPPPKKNPGSAPVIYSSLYLLNAKYALLYAIQYSQLSSNRLPMVHDKVVACGRLSSVGKKKEEYLKFLPHEEVVVT